MKHLHDIGYIVMEINPVLNISTINSIPEIRVAVIGWDPRFIRFYKCYQYLAYYLDQL